MAKGRSCSFSATKTPAQPANGTGNPIFLRVRMRSGERRKATSRAYSLFVSSTLRPSGAVSRRVPLDLRPGVGRGDEMDGTISGRLLGPAPAQPVFAAAFGIGVLFVGSFLWRARSAYPGVFRLWSALLVVLVAQAILGEVQYRNALPWGLVLVHVILAAAIWVLSVGLAWALWRPPTPFARK